MAWIKDVVVDCRHPASAARFWAAVLDGYDVAPYDEAELERLRSEGIFSPEDDPAVKVEAAPGVWPRFFFVLVPEPKTAKNRFHLDLVSEDLDTEVERLTGLGARVLDTYDDHVVLADPEGNEFCLFPS
ncbi:VOC family protein [Sphaerisporangium sp. B11E5]|uniref:VOC family protein n=1 Tax=Sphaerisporangium sp. B11E5 TaxID=3153563 RepID=UPI00325E222F